MEKPDVFISYTRTDAVIAEALQDELESRGLNVWRDKTGVRRNEDFAVEIVDAIFHSAALVVLWSPASNDSPWVQDEALLGYSLNRLIGLFVQADMHQMLPPPYKTLDSQTFNLNLPKASRDAVLANVVTDIGEARTRTPLYMRQRPPARKSRDEALDAFTHSVLNAKFCFEAYGGDAERSIHTRFLAAITELRGWADQSVREAVSRFGDGNSPGEAIWALYAVAEVMNSRPLWIAVGRAVRPFSIVMSIACLRRGGMTGESIKSEFYPTPVAKLLKRRRKSVPRPKKRKPPASLPASPQQASAPQPGKRPATEAVAAAAKLAVQTPPKAATTTPQTKLADVIQPIPAAQPKNGLREGSSEGAPAEGVDEIQKAKRGRRTIGGALALAVLIALCFSGWFFVGRGKQPPDEPPIDGPTRIVDPNPPGAGPSPRPAPEPRIYIVQNRESCWAIALRLTGDGSNCADLQPLNPALNLQGWDSLIRPGDKLVVPSDGPWSGAVESEG